MSRALKSAEEIQREVVRLIHQNQEVKEDGATVSVPAPTPLVAADADGCNWSMTTFSGDRSYVGVVEHAVAEVKRKWNLRP